MSDHLATPSPAEVSIEAHSATLPAAVVEYVVQLLPVENPLGLKALQYQRIYQVWKVLMVQGQVVQVLALLSSSVVDERYIYN
jgi:hypothetical protein